MNNIDNLLKDISIRHACKNVDKYVADVEKAIGIKLVPVNNSLEFTWSKDFEWFANVRDAKQTILNYFNLQKPKIFSIIDYEMSGHRLFFTFKFHPGNAI